MQLKFYFSDCITCYAYCIPFLRAQDICSRLNTSHLNAKIGMGKRWGVRVSDRVLSGNRAKDIIKNGGFQLFYWVFQSYEYF